MATEQTGITETPDDQPVNALRGKAYELLATEAANIVGSDEDDATERGTQTAAAETDPETETETTAEDDKVLSQNEDDQTDNGAEAGTEGESQTVPIKRLNKEVARRKKLEEEVRALRAKSKEGQDDVDVDDIGVSDPEVTRLTQEETIAKATYGLASDLLGKLRRAAADDDEDAKAKLIGEVEATLREKKVTLRDFSADVMSRYLESVADDHREKLDDLRVKKHVHQARAEERAGFERQANDAKAVKHYPWLKDESSKEYHFAKSVAQMLPGLRKSPAGLLVLGDTVNGALARMASEKAAATRTNGTTSTNSTTAPRVTHSRTAAPLPAAKGELAGTVKRVLENPEDQQARTKFFSSFVK